MPRSLMPQLPEETALAIKRAGGRRALAEQLGLVKSAIRHWERVPVQHVRRVSEITGLEPHDIRPDVFPPTKLQNRIGPKDWRDCSQKSTHT